VNPLIALKPGDPRTLRVFPWRVYCVYFKETSKSFSWKNRRIERNVLMIQEIAIPRLFVAA
jgi:hypothetical protein